MDNSGLNAAHLRAWESLVRAHGALIKAICAEMSENCEIGLETYEVLLTLEQAPRGRMTMGDLAHSVMLSPSGVTRLVDRLQRAGLVERAGNPQDKRSFHTVITKKGVKTRERAWPGFRDGIRDHFAAQLTDEEAETLTHLLLKFVKSDIGAQVHL